MATTTGQSADIFDADTGEWVGKANRQGREQNILSVSERRELLTALRSEGVQRPYRMVTFGDSRAVAASNAALAVTGSAHSIQGIRTPLWLAGALGDTEIVGNFGLSGDLASGWNSTSRTTGRTITNLIAAAQFKGGPVDFCYIQYGINDIVAWNGVGQSAFEATTVGYLKSLCGAVMGAGIKVVFEAINPGTAAGYGANAALKLSAHININATMQEWLSGFPRQAVFANTFSSLVDATGYANTTYYTDGLHFNWLGAMLSGRLVAASARTILPQKRALTYTSGSLLQPNLIDWSGPTLHAVSDTGTVTFNTPTWNVDPVLGMPYAEVTMTCGALAGAYARGHLEVHATTISGGSPRYPISVGDELQGSCYLVIDDGNGGVPPIQDLVVRHRLYSDTKYSDVGLFLAAAGPNFAASVAHRFHTPTIVTATASAGISAPAAGAGYSLQPHVEFNAVGQSCRMRVYAPSLRVVSPAAQPTQPTAGASPYTYTNTTGSPVTLYVAGGTVSSIGLSRQGSVLTTGFTSGAFRLAQNDSLTITYTVIPTLTLVPDEQR